MKISEIIKGIFSKKKKINTPCEGCKKEQAKADLAYGKDDSLHAVWFCDECSKK